MCDSNDNSSIKSDTSIKKKRGRKPKVKKDDGDVNEVKVPKKRGRKPKNLSKNENVEVKIPKKRGRKPAGKIINIENSDKKDSITIDDCIITHLPIKMSDIIPNNEESEVINDSISENQEEDEIYTETIDNNDNPDVFIKSDAIRDIELMDKTSLINYYNQKIREIENKYKDSSITMTGKKVYETEVKFNYIDESKKNKWRDNTNIHCWWCCHSFDTPPVSLPEKIFDKTYYVFGCFCSFNCAYSYNININDYKIWERLSMLKSLYRKIYNNDKDILPAPPRKALNMFGGHLSIDEFRNNNLFNKKEYLYLIPPMVSIIPIIGESNTNTDNFNKDKKFVPLTSMKNLKLSEKLKRNKPVNNTKYSLVKTMGLKKKTKKEKNEFFI